MKTHIPELRRSRVVVSYGANDGYSSLEKFNNVPGLPNKAILNGIRELSRLAALFGFSAEAEASFKEAQEAVAQWKKENGHEA